MTQTVSEPIDIGSLLFNPQGRVGRGPFWAGWGILFGAGIVANFIPFIGLFISLGLIYCGVCVYGKRLHDMGKSAWIYGGYLIVSIIGGILAGFMFVAPFIDKYEELESMPEQELAMMLLTNGGPALLIVLLLWLVGLALLLWCGIAGGERGDNQYGPDPRVYS